MIRLEELPTDWSCDRFKDIAALRLEKTQEVSTDKDYLELEDIEQGTGRLLSTRSTEDVDSAVTKFYKGDVLFGKLRPYLEKYWLAEFDGKCTGEILVFRAERITPQFLKYCVASTSFTKICVAMSYGTKMPRVNWPKQLATINLPLPPSEDQIRIAHYLDQTCAAIDRILAVKRQQLKKTDQLQKSIICKAVTKGLDDSVEMKESESNLLGKIPNHWSELKIKNISEKVGSGVTPKGGGSTYLDRGIPLLRSQNIHFNGIRLDDVAYIDHKTHDKMSNSKVRVNDVLLNITGASIGRVYFVDADLGEANVNQHVCIVRPRIDILNRFLYYYLFSDVGQAQILSGFTGASREGLTIKEIKNFVLALPPPHEQTAIADFIKKESQKISRVQDAIRSQILVLRDYKKSLIHECVTGKRYITEADLEQVA